MCSLVRSVLWPLGWAFHNLNDVPRQAEKQVEARYPAAILAVALIELTIEIALLRHRLDVKEDDGDTPKRDDGPALREKHEPEVYEHIAKILRVPDERKQPTIDDRGDVHIVRVPLSLAVPAHGEHWQERQETPNDEESNPEPMEQQVLSRLQNAIEDKHGQGGQAGDPGAGLRWLVALDSFHLSISIPRLLAPGRPSRTDGQYSADWRRSQPRAGGR